MFKLHVRLYRHTHNEPIAVPGPLKSGCKIVCHSHCYALLHFKCQIYNLIARTASDDQHLLRRQLTGFFLSVGLVHKPLHMLRVFVAWILWCCIITSRLQHYNPMSFSERLTVGSDYRSKIETRFDLVSGWHCYRTRTVRRTWTTC